MAGFKVIRPDALKADSVRSEVRKAMHQMGIKVKATFRGTTSNWKEENQPRYNFETKSLKHSITLTVWIGGNTKIFDYVSLGTEQHIILPRNAKRLAFRTGHTAKTKPGSLTSGPGGSSGPTVYAKGVVHPGNEPRDFEGQVEEKYAPTFPQLVDEAIAKGVASSGHAI